jgi:hypothetical protein
MSKDISINDSPEIDKGGMEVIAVETATEVVPSQSQEEYESVSYFSLYRCAFIYLGIKEIRI